MDNSELLAHKQEALQACEEANQSYQGAKRVYDEAKRAYDEAKEACRKGTVAFRRQSPCDYDYGCGESEHRISSPSPRACLKLHKNCHRNCPKTP